MDRLHTLQPTQSTSCTVCTWSQTLLHAHPSTATAQPKFSSTPSTEYLIQYHGRMIDWPQRHTTAQGFGAGLRSSKNGQPRQSNW